MRARSHWGWGFADEFPVREARIAIGEQLPGLVGFSAPGIADPVPLEAVTLAPSSLSTTPLLDTSADARLRHTHGRGLPDVMRGFFGEFGGAPDAVSTPRGARELEELLGVAEREGLRVVPFGGGTSVVGGVESPRDRGQGVVSLDLGGFSGVRELDETSLVARIGAGTLGPVLEAQLAESGLTLRHYPQSFEHSTLGGWIATRAGGHFATGRTRIDEFVEALSCLTPRGWIETGRFPSSGAGPDPLRLIIGSEGTLGVITEAWMRVQRRPRFRARATLSFETFWRATEAVRAILQAGLLPANARVLDPAEAALNSVRSDGRAVLLLGFESADHAPREGVARAVALAEAEHGQLDGAVRVQDDAEGRPDARWRQAFLAGPSLQGILLSLGVLADTFETAAPWSRFQELDTTIRAAVEDVLRRVAGGGKLSCRVTHAYPDGLAPYYTFLLPVGLDPVRLLQVWREVKAAASDAIARAGGTITHHHAVGRTHAPWAERERPALFTDVLRAAKRTLDPAGLLNPGVLFEP